ncbi:hypothetical protein ruthe_00572 [Rubellimicrobium thermophilum DSM 16684]|uniref:DUF3618 domain-containing protein n=1 Tax=Rubellimicrobium thermophilum DSM 16684 TaxID=1123069 RepID=S9R1G1_9RHOB|nr:hypothetical protein [Rubellimicrobium thermophilum]EPX87501.1 hypothetical protein ruthe_00572 [Rubellimicrobium thermophilum DSM 16684]
MNGDAMDDDGRSIEDLLDNTPEAVAMRRARAAREEAARKAAAAGRADPAAARRSTRRQWIAGLVFGGLMAARAFERAVRR